MKYRTQFESMLEKLKQNPKIRVKSRDFPPPARDSAIAEAAGLIHGPLPSGLEAFHREMDGFDLEWDLNGAKDDTTRGFIHLLPLRKILQDWEGTTWFSDMKDGDRYRPVKPVDNFVPEACAALCVAADSGVPDEIYYHYFGEELENTRYTFDEYIERLLRSRGLFYWIKSLCANAQGSEEVKNFRQNMPRIFDDYDDKLFQPKR